MLLPLRNVLSSEVPPSFYQSFAHRNPLGEAYPAYHPDSLFPFPASLLSQVLDALSVPPIYLVYSFSAPFELGAH